MTQPAERLAKSFEDYLKEEAASPTRHEWLRGDVYAMAGGSPEHAAVAANVVALLSALLRARPCRVYTSDARLRVVETGLATYPDVSVVCGRLETDVEDPLAITNPLLLVEVLSPTTEAYDRGAKFAHYRRIPSLREVVFVAHRERRLEVYRRDAVGRWVLYEAGAGEAVELESLGGELVVDEVYRDPLAL